MKQSEIRIRKNSLVKHDIYGDGKVLAMIANPKGFRVAFANSERIIQGKFLKLRKEKSAKRCG